MLPLFVHVFRAFFLDELAFRRWIRGALFAVAGSGLTFAEQLASVIEAPHSVKTIRVAAVIAMFIGGSIQSSARKTDTDAQPAPRGFARLGGLFVLAAIAAALLACASSSQSAGVLHETTSSSSDEHAASSADVTDHLEDHGQERIDENVVTTRSGGAIDLDVVTTKPDGTKIEKHLHRAPVEVKRDASKTAAVQKALTEDAHATVTGTDDKHDQAAGTKQAASTSSSKSAPAIGCQLGGLVFAVGFAVAIGGIIVYALRRAKRAASAIDPLP